MSRKGPWRLLRLLCSLGSEMPSWGPDLLSVCARLEGVRLWGVQEPAFQVQTSLGSASYDCAFLVQGSGLSLASWLSQFHRKGVYTTSVHTGLRPSYQQNPSPSHCPAHPPHTSQSGSLTLPSLMSPGVIQPPPPTPLSSSFPGSLVAPPTVLALLEGPVSGVRSLSFYQGRAPPVKGQPAGPPSRDHTCSWSPWPPPPAWPPHVLPCPLCSPLANSTTALALTKFNLPQGLCTC